MAVSYQASYTEARQQRRAAETKEVKPLSAEVPARPAIAAPARLGLWSATALVIASMVGTGLFTTSGFLLVDLKTPSRVLWVWLGGGLLACLGALSYGALVRRIPESGGEYVFLSRTLHPAAGYIAGWVSFFVGFSAPLAFAAFAFGEYSKAWWPACPAKVSGTMLIVVLSLIHGADVRRGAWLQNLTVLLKLALLAGFVGLAFMHLTVSPLKSAPPIPVSTWAVSLMWVSFSYSGWNAAVYIAGEVRDAERNLPRAMLLGTLLVTLIYLLVNAVFVYSAPTDVLAGKPAIGQIAAGALGGPVWANAVTSLVAIVLVSSVSAQVMAGPRVYAKMAADGYLPHWLAVVDGPPRLAIALQTVAGLTMLWSATFEWFLTYIGFTLGLSTAATVVGLVRIRLKEGAKFGVPGWPWVPALFLLGVGTTTVLSVIGKPLATAAGLATIGLGWVAWRLQRLFADSTFAERGGSWVVGQSVLMIAVIALAMGFPNGNIPGAVPVAAAMLFITGAVFGIAGVWVLRGSRTAFPRPPANAELVRTGIYAYVRHPLYTSVMLISIGWALFWGSWVALAPAILMIPFFHAKAKVEECRLREKYPEYAEYAQRVPAFLPRPWSAPAER